MPRRPPRSPFPPVIVAGGFLVIVVAMILAVVVGVDVGGWEVSLRASAATAAEPAVPGADAGYPTGAGSTQDDPRIQRIRRLFRETNSEFARTAPMTLALEGYSAEGGDLWVFADGRGVRKLVTRLHGETGRQHSELYYDDGGLYFAFLIEVRYQWPFGPVSDSTEHRLYFQDRQLIRWLAGERPAVHHASDAYSEVAARTLELSDEMYRRATEHLGGADRGAFPRSRDRSGTSGQEDPARGLR